MRVRILKPKTTALKAVCDDPEGGEGGLKITVKGSQERRVTFLTPWRNSGWGVF